MLYIDKSSYVYIIIWFAHLMGNAPITWAVRVIHHIYNVYPIILYYVYKELPKALV